MIVCPNCGKENQDHYKFCLGCGSDLPRAAAEEQTRSTPTPPAGIPAMSADAAPEPSPEAEESTPESAPQAMPVHELTAPPAAPLPLESPETESSEPGEAPEEAAAPQDDGKCVSCGANITPGFAFCGACGTPIPGIQPGPSSLPQQPAPDSARLMLIQPDGSEGGQVEIPTSEVAVGRDAGGFFGSDPFLSPTHAVFRADGKKVTVKDADSLNGVFLKINPNKPVEIKSGNIFRMGQELILFEEVDKGSAAADGTERMGSPIEGLWGRVALIIGRGRLGNAFPVGGDGIVFGRERGNVLFPEDGYVSGIHLKLHKEKGKFFLTDLGSSNGTFLKITNEIEVEAGAFMLMGQQLFRVDI